MCPPLDILIGPGLPLSVAHATGRRDRIGAPPSARQRRASPGAARVLPVQRRGVRHVGGDPAVRLRADRPRIGRRRGIDPARPGGAARAGRGVTRRPVPSRTGARGGLRHAGGRDARDGLGHDPGRAAGRHLRDRGRCRVVAGGDPPDPVGAAAVAGRVAGGADGGQRGERDRGRCRCPGRATDRGGAPRQRHPGDRVPRRGRRAAGGVAADRAAARSLVVERARRGAGCSDATPGT